MLIHLTKFTCCSEFELIAVVNNQISPVQVYIKYVMHFSRELHTIFPVLGTPPLNMEDEDKGFNGGKCSKTEVSRNNYSLSVIQNVSLLSSYSIKPLQ